MEIFWDEATKNVHLQVNMEVCKNWAFVKAALGMAEAAAEHEFQMHKMFQMQQKAQEEALHQPIRSQIGK